LSDEAKTFVTMGKNYLGRAVMFSGRGSYDTAGREIGRARQSFHVSKILSSCAAGHGVVRRSPIHSSSIMELLQAMAML
ncbi:hypothetical protein VIGAN_11042600, partial [Vigna angularis var. angularis]